MVASADTILPLLERKRAAHLAHQLHKSSETHSALKTLKAEVQKVSRTCANDYWMNLCQEIQSAADTGDAQTMYAKINVALGPRVNVCAPLKSADGIDICDKAGQLDR